MESITCFNSSWDNFKNRKQQSNYLSIQEKKEIENRSREKWNDCFGAKRKIANV